ncbi:MAG TPA: molybdopterin-dependent oxidoreductase [Desulfatiglandales bacterium]|nr:molybdopterin-dependent oxidoreductase [Desulfatiglandales bacterium]
MPEKENSRVLEKERAWTWREDDLNVVRSIARTGPGCHEGCGVLLYVKDGKLVKVEGDPEFPPSQGRLCPRCLALTQVVYHPDRLRYPMKRVGKRGEGKWERITWEEAYQTIVEKFEAIKSTLGPESVIFCQGTGRDIGPYISRLAYSFGSPNRVTFGPLHGHACFAPKVTALAATTGDFEVSDCSQFVSDRYENANWKTPQCIILWGNNPLTSNPDGFLGHWIIECMKRGSEIIVVDPRRTWLATRAKIWMQIRPGTDAALALGMLNVIISEKLYDDAFVGEWTYGFEELKRRVQDYPPEKVAEIIWIPKQKIIKAGRMYATAKPAAIQWGVSIDQSKECVPTIHAIMSLWAITGNLDVPGGNVIKSHNFDLETEINKELQAIIKDRKKKKIGIGKYPLLDDWYTPAVGSEVIEQMLSDSPYPIKAAWIQTTNTFACGAADPKRVYEAFRKLDFVVVVDLFMTPTAMAFADIVLPAATYAERDGIALTGGNTIFVGTINKAIEPVGECKSDMEINLELGRRLNPSAWPWNDVQGMFSGMLGPTGMSFEELREIGFAYDTFEYRKYEKGLLRPDKKPGFDTPTGKVELYSTVFEECGLDPLPYFEEPPESPVSTPEIANEFPLVLTTGGKSWGFFHSEHRQIPLLRQMNPDPITEIHPETAEKLGIEDGDWIYIENKHGRCQQRAKVTAGIHPRVVHAQHGWWFPEKPGPDPSLFGAWESNINLLLPSGWVGRSGFGYPFKAQMCRVYKKEKS